MVAEHGLQLTTAYLADSHVGHMAVNPGVRESAGAARGSFLRAFGLASLPAHTITPFAWGKKQLPRGQGLGASLTLQ